MSTTTLFKPDQRRQHGQKEPCVDAVEEHLKDAVEGHQSGGVIGVSLRQLIPHNHHGDAARQANQNQPGPVLRIAAQKDDRQRKHQHRADHPVLHQREAQHLAIAKDLAQPLILHLGQRRIHHQDQAHGDGNVRRARLIALQQRGHIRHKAPQRNAGRHGQKDPKRQKAVDERQL